MHSVLSSGPAAGAGRGAGQDQGQQGALGFIGCLHRLWTGPRDARRPIERGCTALYRARYFQPPFSEMREKLRANPSCHAGRIRAQRQHERARRPAALAGPASSRSSPPKRSAIDLTIARPSPVPGCVTLLPRKKRSPARARSAGGMPGPSSTTAIDADRRRVRHADRHLAAARRVADRVVQQVGQRLLQQRGCALTVSRLAGAFEARGRCRRSRAVGPPAARQRARPARPGRPARARSRRCRCAPARASGWSGAPSRRAAT